MAYQLEYRFRHKNGQYRWLQDQFTVIRNAAGEPGAWIGSVSDITERKRAEAEIHRLNATLEQQVQERTAQLESALTELNRAPTPSQKRRSRGILLAEFLHWLKV